MITSRYLSVLCLLVACKPSALAPHAVTEQFLTHLSRSEGAQAQELLCPRDQAMLAALASRLGRDPITSLNGLQPRDGANFQVLPRSQTDDSAEVDVIATGGMRFPLTLSRQSNSWCLHLPQLSP